jgi:PAS domain S-box-containing protein
LLVEDNPTDVLLVRASLEQDKFTEFRIAVAETLGEGLSVFRQAHFDVVLLDLGLPDSMGLATFERWRDQAPDVPVMICSGAQDEETAVQAVRMGAQDYLVKDDIQPKFVVRAIRYAIERYKLAHSLVESETRFSTAFFNNPAPQSIIDPINSKIMAVNNACCQLFGYSREELMGNNPEKLNLWQDPADKLTALEELQRTGHLLPREVTVRVKSGETRTVMVAIEPIMWQGVLCLISTILDITERKRAEELLRESEAHFHGTLDTMQEGIMLIGWDWRYLYINKAAETQGRRPAEELLGKAVMECWPGFEATPYFQLEQKVMRERQSAEIEGQFTFPDGEIRWFHWNVQPASVGLLIVTQDITPRKQVEAALQESEEKFRSVVECSPDIIFSVDRQMRIKFINRVPPGITVEESLGKSALDYVPPEYHHRVKTEIQRVFETGQSCWYEIQARGPYDSIAWYSTRLASLNRGTSDEQVLLITEDITERKRAEEKLQESEERFREFANVVDEGFWVLDWNNQHLDYFNPAYKNIWKYSAEQHILDPNTFFETIFPDDLPIVRQAIERRSQGETVAIEYRIILPDQSLHWVWDRTFPVFDAEGNLARILGVVTDITERKQVEDTLRASEEKYHRLSLELEERVAQRTAEIETIRQRLELATHAAGLGVWDLDLRTGKLFWDDQIYATYGLDRNAFQPSLDSFMSIVHPEDVAKLISFTQEALSGKTENQIEYRVLCNDGVVKHIRVQGLVLKDTAGQVDHLIGVIHDITQSKLAQEALKASEVKYRLLFENMTEGFSLQEIITDANGEPVDFRFLDANSAYGHHTGLQSQEVIGKTILEIMPQADRRQIEMYGKVALTGEPMAYEYFSKTFNRHFAVRVFSPRHGQFASTFEDITERKQAEQALQFSRDQLDLANHELARASRLKDEFLANMSHELRTPLNAILGLTQVLSEQMAGPLNTRQLESINIVESSGKHLLDLINDILDLSKIEAGNMTLNMEPVRVNSVCHTSLSFIKEIAHKKNIKVSSHLDQTVEWIQVDERRFKQMLVNLLTNAVKFTPAGGAIELAVTGSREHEIVQFSVRDTGIGIAPEDLKRLFKPFTQVDSSMTRQFEGTGLGLSLVKRMAELHGGSVSVESQLGKGSLFTITLPWNEMMQRYSHILSGASSATVAVPMSDSSVSQPEAHAPLILIAEDNQTNTTMLELYLSARGYQLVFAKHGGEALDLARSEHPALILMDLQMPVMDGYEAMRRLRQDSDPAIANIPVIALTALAMPSDRERAFTVGANAYMSKPVDLKQLVELINGCIQAK